MGRRKNYFYTSSPNETEFQSFPNCNIIKEIIKGKDRAGKEGKFTGGVEIRIENELVKIPRDPDDIGTDTKYEKFKAGFTEWCNKTLKKAKHV